MKTLANCNPREFLVQTNKIRKAVAEWLTLTKIMEIRKTLPEFEKSASKEERREALQEQIKRNLNAMLDAVLEQYPNETAELLGLMCFVEPEDLDNHKMTEFLGAAAEMMNSQEIIDFFISLARLESMNIGGTAKA